MSDVDTSKPPAALAAFFELQQWCSLTLVERERLLKVFAIGKAAGAAEAFVRGDLPIPLNELEGMQVRHVLKLTGGAVGRAAKLLGIGRATLYRRLAELGGEREGVDASARAQVGDS